MIAPGILIAWLGSLGLVWTNAVVNKAILARGTPVHELLLFRGIGCAAIAITIALLTGTSLRPKTPALQLRRFVVAGVAILLGTLSFRYLSATTGTLISKIDIPLLILLGAGAASKSTWIQRALGASALIALILPAAWAETTGQSLIGFISGVGGAVIVTYGYFLLRSTSQKESIPVAALVPALAIACLGGLNAAITGTAPHNLDLLLAVAPGMCMYGLYHFSVVLYRVLPIAHCEYPALIGAVLLIPMDVFYFGYPFPLQYVLILCAASALLAAAIFQRSSVNVAR